MINWLSQWWRYILLVLAIGAVTAVAKRFIDGWIADAVITVTTLAGGSNMVLELFSRSFWKQQLAEKDQEIAGKDQEIAGKDQEIAGKDQEIAERDETIAARDREISELRQQLEQRYNGGEKP